MSLLEYDMVCIVLTECKVPHAAPGMDYILVRCRLWHRATIPPVSPWKLLDLLQTLTPSPFKQTLNAVAKWLVESCACHVIINNLKGAPES